MTKSNETIEEIEGPPVTEEPQEDYVSSRLKPYVITPKRAAADGMNILIYGPQGTGKTHLIGTAQDNPAMADVLLCNVEGGIKTIASRKDIRAIDIEDFAHLEEVFWAVAERKGAFKTIKTIAIDSVTELQVSNLQDISKKGGRVDKVHLEDYGKSTLQLSRIFRMFKDLKINVIMTALPKDTYPDGSEAQKLTIPNLTNKLASTLMGYMDMVWYLDVAEDETKVDKKGFPIQNRYLLTRKSNGYSAKTRGVNFAKALGPVVQDPNLSELYDVYIKSEGA